MAGTKISQLPAVATPTLSDVVPEVQGTTTYKATLQQLSTLFGFSTGILAPSAGGTGTSSFVTGSSLVAGATDYMPVTFVGRNRLINGDMQVWQRGAGGSASFAVAASTTQYTADRWQIVTNANQASVVSQQALSPATGFVAQVQRNSAQTGTGTIAFATSLTTDMCNGVAGNKITVSFRALAGANYSAAANALNVTLYAGTGSNQSGVNGAFTGTTTALNSTATLTTVLSKFSFSTSLVIPSNATQLCLQFNFVPTGTAGTNDYFQVTDVQLEVSPNATPYDRRTFTESLVLCQRFYNKTFPYSVVPSFDSMVIQTPLVVFVPAGAPTSFVLTSVWYFPTSMLVINPVMTVFGVDSMSNQWSDGLGDFVQATVGNVSEKQAVFGSNTSLTVPNVNYTLHATADCDLT